MKISVAMCVYNGVKREHLQKAIKSIYTDQTRHLDEFIVVVDGPVRQELKEVLIDIAKNTDTKVIWNDVNQGYGLARACALAASSYDWIALMDSDDIAVPMRLELQENYISNHRDIDVLGGNIEEFDSETGDFLGKRIVPQNNDEIYRYMKSRSPFNNMTVMLRKKAVLEAGGYLDWPYDEDYYLWIRMALKKMKFANLPEILVHARADAGMYARRGGIVYFKSEAKLQQYMLNHQVISYPQYIWNIFLRIIVQILSPNFVRKFIYKYVARKK